MINISPLRDFQKNCYIPPISELDSYFINDNVTYALYDMDSDLLDPRNAKIIRKNDPEFDIIKSKIVDVYPFSKLITINGKTFSCSSGFTLNPLTSTYWSYIGQFHVNEELWIADPCYFNSLNPSMRYRCKLIDEDTFYAFCNLGDLDMCSSTTDIIIINELMMHECSIVNYPITILGNDIEPIMNIYVDSGCVVMCDALNASLDFEKWYEANVFKISRIGMLKTTEGVLTSSGYGDGAYPLFMYHNKNKGHVAYLVNFLSNNYE